VDGGPAAKETLRTHSRTATSAMTGRVQVVTNDEDAQRPLLSRLPSDIDLDMTTLDTRHGHEKWRRIVGLLLLFTTVVLWTASNFMASVCPYLLFSLLFA
jgi:hypothetical protein